MKPFLVIVLVALFAVPATLHAADFSCSVPTVKIQSGDTHAEKIAKIKDALANYRKHIPSFISAKSNRYEICFDMPETLELKPGDFNKDDLGVFTIVTSLMDKREIQIVGLKLKRGDGLELGDKPVIRIIADAGTKITFKNVNVLNTENGFRVIGSGLVELEQSQITSDSIKTDENNSEPTILLPENRTSSEGLGLPLS